MRVTRNMMIHDMVYWSSKQLDKLNQASTVVASGKEINKPSDNATATRRILEDRTTLSSYDQYEYNIELAQTWINFSDTTLSSVYSLLQEAQDVIISDISQDGDDAETIAMTLQAIYDQILSMANELYGTEYMYGGNSSDTVPFSSEVTISGGTADDIIYNLASDASSTTVEVTDDDGNVVRTITVSGGSEGTNTVVWDGLDDSGNALPDGDYTFMVTAADSGGAAVASYPAYRGGSESKEFVIGKSSTISLNNNGDSIFSPALKVLSRMITALQDTAATGVSTADFADDLDTVATGIKNQEALLSNANTIATNISDRLDAMINTIENRVSDLENGDITTAAAELTSQKTTYEVTQKALASVLTMPKLSDYL